MNENDIKQIASKFDIVPTNIETLRTGHINDTFCITTAKEKFLLQRINNNVFKNPDNIVNNIFRITDFIERKGATTIHMIPTIDGRYCLKFAEGYWRVYNYIENTISPEEYSDEELYQVAFGFGSFQHYLDGFAADTLFISIEDFHNTPVRYENLLEAASSDPIGRLKNAKEELRYFMQHKGFYNKFDIANAQGKLPIRVTHNDTKSNNILLDKETKKVRSVIDLDTVMPGYIVNDFGDLIRSSTSTAAEDEKDLSKVHFNIDAFRICLEGFVDGCAGILSESEKDLLCDGALMMTIECGMRFLEDYLRGDIYFKTDYDTHNLVRCKTQIRLASEIEEHWDELKQMIKNIG